MFYFFGKTRFVILALSTVCLTLILSNMVALNFTVICMTKEVKPHQKSTVQKIYRNMNSSKNRTHAKIPNNTKVSILTKQPMYSTEQQGWLFSAYAVGQLIGTWPITPTISRIGFRYTMTIYGVVSAVATLLIPLCADYAGFLAVFFMRILQGTAVAAVWVATGAITAAWSPLNNYGIFLSLLSCNNQFGPVISMPLAGAICASPNWHWPTVYYILGSATLIMFGIFFGFYSDSPRIHKFVSPQELALIEEGKLVITKTNYEQKVPYKAILSDIVIWGLFVSFIASTAGIQLLMQYGPVFFNKALGINAANTGLDAAMPFLLCAILKIFSGPMSDGIKCMSERAKVQLFASTSQYVMGLCFLLLGFLPKFGVSSVPILQACYTGAAAAIAFNVVGVFKSTQFVAGQFAHIVYAWVAILTSISWLIVPSMVAWLTPTNSLGEWSMVYSIAAAIVAGGTTLFNCTAKVEPRPWAMIKKKSEQNAKDTVEKSGQNAMDTVTKDTMPRMLCENI